MAQRILIKELPDEDHQHACQGSCSIGRISCIEEARDKSITTCNSTGISRFGGSGAIEYLADVLLQMDLEAFDYKREGRHL